MGQTIEKIALSKNHQISLIIDHHNLSDLKLIHPDNTDVAIEFTQPESAFENLRYCMEQQVPAVSGTTGWLDRRSELEAICLQNQSAFFYASNYSIGVNIFFKVNQFLAKLMSQQSNYSLSLEEIHHTEKKDAPSGTAITLAQDIMLQIPHKTSWINEATDSKDLIGIISKRESHVPGTHTVKYACQIDEIEIKHTAYSREGFAQGAVLAAEWLKDKKGVFGMDDMLSF